MPSYRGVAQKDLVASINDAVEMLEKYSPGSEMQDFINGLRQHDDKGKSKLGDIVSATTDEELVAAMRASNIQWLFVRSGDLLNYHAAANTDGKGRDVLLKLVEWNATGGMMTHEYNEFDKQADTWLALHYVQRADFSGEGLATFGSVVGASTNNKQMAANVLKAAVHMDRLVTEGASDAKISNVFVRLPISEKQILKAALMELSGQNEVLSKLEFKSNIGAYGLVIEGFDPTRRTPDAKIAALARNVQRILSPFAELDEVDMIAVGSIDKQRRREGPFGIMFVTSERGAQAVADALPDMKVIDFDGKPIPPRATPPSPAPVTGPSPTP